MRRITFSFKKRTKPFPHALVIINYMDNLRSLHAVSHHFRS